MPDRPVLVTGAAGFVGYHVAERLLQDGRRVVGVDSFSDYYDPGLKEARFSRLERNPRFDGRRLDLADGRAVADVFAEHLFAEVIHLAAQPGVRYALENPDAYAASNLTAFVNVLEGCRHSGARHLVFASSSSVYGSNRKLPFEEGDAVDHPISLYAATKRANELMAHAYAHLFGCPVTGLRFFTVYGPWGRPDMAIYRFTDRIAKGEPIEVAAAGEVERDFTYIDDVVEGVVGVLGRPPAANEGGADLDDAPQRGAAPFRVYNIGGDRPADLNRVIALIEVALGVNATRRDVPLPAGDVLQTRAATDALRALLGFIPETPLETGIPRFVDWYRAYHGRASADHP